MRRTKVMKTLLGFPGMKKNPFFTYGVFGSAARWFHNGRKGTLPRDIDIAVWSTPEFSGERGVGEVCDVPVILHNARRWAESVGLPADLAIDAHWMPTIGTPVGVESVFILLGDCGYTFCTEEVKTLTAILRAAEFNSVMAREVFDHEVRAERMMLWLDYRGIHLRLDAGWTQGYAGEGLQALKSALGHTPRTFLQELGALGDLLSEFSQMSFEELVAMSGRFFENTMGSDVAECEKYFPIVESGNGFELRSDRYRVFGVSDLRDRAGL